jgi:hypothetical protein
MTATIASGPAPELAPPVPVEAHGPYKFLNYFEDNEVDQGRFAGRDRDLHEALSRISKARTFVLYGRSGLGKTSLLKAGLFPRLRKLRYRPIYVRTLTAPLPDLYAAVAREIGGPSCTSPDELRDRLRAESEATRTTIVLVLDQFEEFFIRFRDRRADRAVIGDAAAAPVADHRADRAAFIEAIGTLVDDLTLDVRVVFSLREDYLAELDDFRRALPRLFENQQRLMPLSAFGAREAILRPLQQAGISYSQSLVSRLVDEIGGVGFDPTLLQVVCTEVYGQAVRRAPEDPEMAETDLTELGGLDGIFRRYLMDVTEPISADEESGLVARAVLDNLVTQEKTKQAVSFADLTRAKFRATEDEIARVLGVLLKGRLLRCERRGEQDWYELIHDRLVQYIQEWLDRDPEFVSYRAAYDLVVNSSRGSLWRVKPEALFNIGGVVNPYRDRLRLNPEQEEYVLRCELIHLSPTAVSWAERLGFAASTPILLAYLSDPENRVLRLGAALVAGDFPDPEGRIAEACLARIADPVPEVRHAAGRSWARLHRTTPGRPWAGHRPAPAATADRPAAPRGAWMRRIPTFSALARTIRTLPGRVRGERTARRQEAEFLAAMLSEGDPLRGISRRRRRWARRMADARSIRLQEASIRAQQIPGTVAGLLAGLAWSIVVGLPLWVLYFHFAGKGDAVVAAIAATFITCVSGAAVGGLLGWLTAIASARETAARGDRFRPLRLTRSKLLRVGMCIVTGGVFLAGGLGELLLVLPLLIFEIAIELSSLGLILFPLAAVVLYPILYPLTVLWLPVLEAASTLILRCVGPRGRTGIWVWAWLGCVGLPFTAALAISGAIFVVTLSWPEGPLMVAIVASYLIATTTLPRFFAPRWAAAGPEPDAVRPPSRAARLSCAGATACLVLLFSAFWGFDSFVTRTFAVPERGQLVIPVTLGPAVPDVSYARVRIDRDALLEIRGPNPQQVEGSIERFEKVAEAATPYFVPAGTYSIKFSRPDAKGEFLSKSSLGIERLDVARSTGTGEISWDGKSPRLVAFALTHDPTADRPGVWSATLGGSIPQDRRAGRPLKLTIHSSPDRIDPGLIMGTDKPPPQTSGIVDAPPSVIERPENPIAFPLDSFSSSFYGATEVSPKLSDSGRWRVNFKVRVRGVDPRKSIVPLLARMEWGEVPPPPGPETAPVISAETPPAPPKDPIQAAIAKVDDLEGNINGPEHVNRTLALNKAIGILREALNEAPNSAPLRARLALSLQRRGDPGSAIVEARQAVELDPENPGYRASLVWDLCLAGRFEEALPHARKAAELKPGDVEIQDVLAHAEYGAGHWREAAAAWAQVGDDYFRDSRHVQCAEDRDHFEDAKRKASEPAATVPAPSGPN